jgi:branched-chain amino acid transport system ATP-binding protein
MSPLLELNEVTKTFGGLSAVNKVSFQVSSEEIVGLIGPNGAGKTTLFNTVAGVYKPDSGKILFEGNSIDGKKPHVIAQMGISRTFQTVRPLPRMTVMENTMMGGLFGRNHTLSMNNAREKAKRLLSYTQLGDKEDVLASDLTLAEQRRLELARALAAEPKLLMLDEVMAGLNLTEIQATLELLGRLNKEMHISLLVIEHVMHAVMKLCSGIVVIDHGSMIAQGKPSEITANEDVIKAYMGEKRAGRSQGTASPKGSTSSPPSDVVAEKAGSEEV